MEMEKKGANLGGEQETLINELNQGREFTKQLKHHIGPLLSSLELCDLLIHKILSSYEKAISLLTWTDFHVDGILETPAPAPQVVPAFSSITQVSKKRKTSQGFTEQVRVYSGTGLGLLDDGYSWRKYGQKDILGANFPRSYYRCTYRRSQGCLATKQVQKLDEDPSVYEITYKGRHTCNQASQSSLSLASIQKDAPRKNKYQPFQEEENRNQSQESLFEFGTVLETKTEELRFVEEKFPSISFPSTPIKFQNVETSTSPEEKNFLGGDFPEFLNTEKSKSYYIPLLPCQNLGQTESNPNEIVSFPTSVFLSPTGGLDFSLDQADFDPNFVFGASDFLF